MAVMDEFKEEREAIKNGTPKEKWNYFWYYYKWRVLAVVGVILFISSFAYQQATKKDTAFYVAMVNTGVVADSTEYIQEFADYAGIDLENNAIYLDTTFIISADTYDETSANSIEKLNIYSAAADLDIMITDTGSFRDFAHGSNFYDLRDILSEEQLEKYEPYFYYVDREVVLAIEESYESWDSTYVPVYADPTKPENMADPVPVGIYLDNIDALSKYYYFIGEDIVIGVYSNTERLDTVFQYIDFLMEKGE